jgi:lipopolysaccharide/colanic/teichoic acid biosynthesis glycosyltransferase
MRRLSLLLLPIGLLAMPFLLGAGHARYSSRPYPFGSQNSVVAYALFGIVHLACAHVGGVPDETEDIQPALLRSTAVSIVATVLWLFFQTIKPGLLPRMVVFAGSPAAFMWSFFCCGLNLRAQRREELRDRLVALVTSHEAADFEADTIKTFPLPELPFSVGSTLVMNHDRPQRQVRELQEIVDRENPNLIVVVDAVSQSGEIVDVLTQVHRTGAKVRTLSMFYDEYLGKISLSELTRMAMLFDVRNLHHPTYRRTKRVIDLVGGLVAGVVCLVVAFPIALLNPLLNRGPLLFRQRRVGLNGEEFLILKFRTMVPTPEEEVGVWTSPDDPRVTRLGRVLRRSHLDEFPQFWNIVRGELSLVGPRPEQPKYVNELQAKEPAYELRHLVVPGLTGWAQVKLRYTANEAAAIEKLQYDLYYLQHQSLALDLRILSRTVRSVLRRRGQ